MVVVVAVVGIIAGFILGKAYGLDLFIFLFKLGFVVAYMSGVAALTILVMHGDIVFMAILKWIMLNCMLPALYFYVAALGGLFLKLD